MAGDEAPLEPPAPKGEAATKPETETAAETDTQTDTDTTTEDDAEATETTADDESAAKPEAETETLTVTDDGKVKLGRNELAMIDKLLARAGSDKTKILRAQLYIADVKDLAGMNAAWDAWVPAGHTPPRATVEAKLANPALKVEIMVQAAL